jgi:hypothetical protein
VELDSKKAINIKIEEKITVEEVNCITEAVVRVIFKEVDCIEGPAIQVISIKVVHIVMAIDQHFIIFEGVVHIVMAMDQHFIISVEVFKLED